MKRIVCLLASLALSVLLLLPIYSTLQAASPSLESAAHGLTDDLPSAASTTSSYIITDPLVLYRLSLLNATHSGANLNEVVAPSEMSAEQAKQICDSVSPASPAVKSLTCQPVILVVDVALPISPAISTRSNAPISVTTRITSIDRVIFNGFVPTNVRVIAGVVTSGRAIIVNVGKGISATAWFSNALNVPCECTDGAGLLQVSEVVVSESGPSIAIKACPDSNPSCKPVLIALTLPPPPPPGVPTTTSPYAGQSIYVLSPTLIFSGSVPASGRVIIGSGASNHTYAVGVGSTITAPAILQNFTIPCVCDDGAGLLQVVEVVIRPEGVQIITPGCGPLFLPLILR